MTSETDDPATARCDEAERLGAQLIVVGNRRVPGASRVLGSLATAVLRCATCDVLVVDTTSHRDQRGSVDRTPHPWQHGPAARLRRRRGG